MKPLARFEDYTREEVHALFAPETRFTPQAGTWGLQGIVPLPDRRGDYVFFVTYGQKQGAHEFDEGITEDGVLTWQSQPKQQLADLQIRGLILHNEDVNSIYLFLRTSAARAYTFLGRLKYLSHDAEREQPVHFKWQILDWSLPEPVARRMNLKLAAAEASFGSRPVPRGRSLVLGNPPVRRDPARGAGEATSDFRARKVPDRSRRDAANRKLGLAGEILVLEYEKAALVAGGRPELAAQVRHVSVLEGDGAGYDILSFTLGGAKKYIEVKTTTGAATTEFFVSSTELAFSQQHADKFYLYRVYDYQEASSSAGLFILVGAIDAGVALTPTQFRAMW